MLEVVGQPVLQGEIEQRREMGRPHDPGEDQPRHDRVGEHPERPRMEDREQPAPADPRRRHAECQRDRRPQRDERRGDQREQDVLDHVDREEGGVVALDPGLERDRDRGQAAEEGDRPDARHPVRRMRGVDPADGDDPRERHDRQGQGDRRIERPAEDEGCASVGGSAGTNP